MNGSPTDADPDPHEVPAARFVEMPGVDGRTRWRIDSGFLTSHWTCIWGAGCQGIHDEPRPELMDGCCSVGVVLADEDEARNIAALGLGLDESVCQYAYEIVERGAIERRGQWWATRVVDGACVFLNRPDFAGGPGCALHHAAVAEDDDPTFWKPRTCSRVPISTDERVEADGTVEVTVRVWRRDDWGPGGATMAWWCTDAEEAYVGERPVIDSMAEPLRELFGDTLYDQVRKRLIDDPG